MNPLRMLYGRRLTARLAYWLSALGLNLRDTSTANRLYSVYFLVFWLIWAVAMYSLVGSNLALILRAVPGVDLPAVWVTLALFALTGWNLWTLWRAGRQSPFVLTEEDAYLLAQTPVARRPLALTLFLSTWVEALVPFVLVTVGLCFATVEFRFPGDMTLEKVGEYARYTGQALLVLLPLHFALQALVWAAGAARLRRARDLPWLRWAAPALLLLIAASAALPTALGGAPLQWTRPLLLWPLTAPLTLGFATPAAAGPWLLAVAAGVGGAALAGAALVYSAGALNLSRAAQETASSATLAQARRYGRSDVVDYLEARRRLQGERRPSPLLRRAGPEVLFAKDRLQTFRALRLGTVLGWLLAGSLAAGVFASPSLPLKLIVGALWVLNAGQVTTLRLRGDLAHWWLFKLLPIPARSVFTLEFALPCAAVVVVGWVSLLLVPLPGPAKLAALALLPALVFNLALAAGCDILRQARVRTLMVPSLAVENVPQIGLGGLLQGLASVALPFWLYQTALTSPAGAFYLGGAVLAALAALVVNLEMIMQAYRWMR